MVGEPRPHPATGRFIREEELREPLFTKDHKVRGHVDGRVINAGLAPVDHPADALRVVDEHMAHVEIAMHHHGEIWPRRIVDHHFGACHRVGTAHSQYRQKEYE